MVGASKNTSRATALVMMVWTLSGVKVEAFLRRLMTSMFGCRQVPGVSTLVGGGACCCCVFCGVEGADEGRRGVVGATKREAAGLGLRTAVEDMMCCGCAVNVLCLRQELYRGLVVELCCRG
jgi:hypothetical protein